MRCSKNYAGIGGKRREREAEEICSITASRTYWSFPGYPCNLNVMKLLYFQIRKQFKKLCWDRWKKWEKI